MPVFSKAVSFFVVAPCLADASSYFKCHEQYEKQHGFFNYWSVGAMKLKNKSNPKPSITVDPSFWHNVDRTVRQQFGQEYYLFLGEHDFEIPIDQSELNAFRETMKKIKREDQHKQAKFNWTNGELKDGVTRMTVCEWLQWNAATPTHKDEVGRFLIGAIQKKFKKDGKNFDVAVEEFAAIKKLEKDIQDFQEANPDAACKQLLQKFEDPDVVDFHAVSQEFDTLKIKQLAEQIQAFHKVHGMDSNNWIGKWVDQLHEMLPLKKDNKKNLAKYNAIEKDFRKIKENFRGVEEAIEKQQQQKQQQKQEFELEEEMKKQQQQQETKKRLEMWAEKKRIQQLQNDQEYEETLNKKKATAKVNELEMDWQEFRSTVDGFKGDNQKVWDELAQWAPDDVDCKVGVLEPIVDHLPEFLDMIDKRIFDQDCSDKIKQWEENFSELFLERYMQLIHNKDKVTAMQTFLEEQFKQIDSLNIEFVRTKIDQDVLTAIKNQFLALKQEIDQDLIEFDKDPRFQQAVDLMRGLKNTVKSYDLTMNEQ